MRLLKAAALAAALICLAGPTLLPIAAFAQDGIVVAAPEPTLVQQLAVAIMPAIGVLISAVLLYAAGILKQKTGIDIEARHRDALQSALLNGVLFAMQKAGWLPGQPIDKLLPAARSYVESSVPDALKQFGIDAGTDIGRATLDRLLMPKLPVPPGTVLPNGDKLIGRAG